MIELQHHVLTACVEVTQGLILRAYADVYAGRRHAIA